MRYARILTAVAGSPWAIHPTKGRAIMEFLAFAAAGGRHAPDEVAQIVGRAPSAWDDDERETPAERQARIEAAEAKAIDDRGGVAVLSLKGVISPRLSDEMDVSGPGGTSAEGFAKRVRAAHADPRVAGIVIDVDSPGGNVHGITEATDALYSLRGQGKPVVAVASPYAASAALWIAASADELVVTPSGEIGSIGVYTWHEDLSKALADAGVAVTLITASQSPNKAEGHRAFPLGEAAKEALQESVDRYGQAFVDAVARGRNVSAAHVVGKFGGGRMLGAADALAAGLVDRVATLDDEVARMSRAIAKPARARASIDSARRRAALW